MGQELGTGLRREKGQDFSSLAWISLSLKSHIPFPLAQGGGITPACTPYPGSSCLLLCKRGKINDLGKTPHSSVAVFGDPW